MELLAIEWHSSWYKICKTKTLCNGSRRICFRYALKKHFKSWVMTEIIIVGGDFWYIIFDGDEFEGWYFKMHQHQRPYIRNSYCSYIGKSSHMKNISKTFTCIC